MGEEASRLNINCEMGLKDLLFKRIEYFVKSDRYVEENLLEGHIGDLISESAEPALQIYKVDKNKFHGDFQKLMEEIVSHGWLIRNPQKKNILVPTYTTLLLFEPKSFDVSYPYLNGDIHKYQIQDSNHKN